MHKYMVTWVRLNQSHTSFDLSRRGKGFVSHFAFDKSNQSRLYLKVQPFEVSRKRKKSLMDLFNTEEKPV